MHLTIFLFVLTLFVLLNVLSANINVVDDTFNKKQLLQLLSYVKEKKESIRRVTSLVEKVRVLSEMTTGVRMLKDFLEKKGSILSELSDEELNDVFLEFCDLIFMYLN